MIQNNTIYTQTTFTGGPSHRIISRIRHEGTPWGPKLTENIQKVCNNLPKELQLSNVKHSGDKYTFYIDKAGISGSQKEAFTLNANSLKEAFYNITPEELQLAAKKYLAQQNI